MSNETERTKPAHVTFATLKLRGGAWLTLQDMHDKARNYKVEFAAALHGKSLIAALTVEMMVPPLGIKSGDRFMVRGFNGKSEFSFTTEVMQVLEHPFVHALLSYPETVEMRVVRNELRAKLSIPVVVMSDGEGVQFKGTMKDLSIAGAMVESAMSRGVVGSKVVIAISTRFETRTVEMNVPAVIRRATKHEKDDTWDYGLEFGDVAQNDKLILYYLLFTLAEGVDRG